jgi:hypothetical protein
MYPASSKGIRMFRLSVLASAIALFALPAQAATSLYSDLYGKTCKTVELDKASGASTRRCAGVAGYSLLVHEANAQTSVDIVTPQGAVYPLEYWEVVTPGLARVGRKAEWRVEKVGAKLAPTALLVRLDTSNQVTSGPRVAAGAILTAARIDADGACVVYQGDAQPKTADAAARSAAASRRKCLGVFTTAASNWRSAPHRNKAPLPQHQGQTTFRLFHCLKTRVRPLFRQRKSGLTLVLRQKVV